MAIRASFSMPPDTPFDTIHSTSANVAVKNAYGVHAAL